MTMLTSLPLYLIAIIASPHASTAFLTPHHRHTSFNLHTPSTTTITTSLSLSSNPFELMVRMPPTNSDLQAQLKINPLLPSSEIIEVRYKVPFGLDVAPKNNLAVCTKDGAGGEKVGDILRYTSMWSMGLPRGDGLMTTAASFAGGLSWQCSLFDVMKAKRWEEVVEALTSNVESRTDEVVLLFEREVNEGESI